MECLCYWCFYEWLTVVERDGNDEDLEFGDNSDCGFTLNTVGGEEGNVAGFQRVVVGTVGWPGLGLWFTSQGWIVHLDRAWEHNLIGVWEGERCFEFWIMLHYYIVKLLSLFQSIINQPTDQVESRSRNRSSLLRSLSFTVIHNCCLLWCNHKFTVCQLKWMS